MLPKITLEEFNKLKEEINKRLEEIRESLDTEEYAKLSDEEQKRIEEEAAREYIKIQNKLFEYDLSDIPFEAWQDMYLLSMGELDLSKSHPNLDFSIVELSSPVAVNLKGCNVRRLDRISAPLDESKLDKEAIESHPDLFLSEIFPPEFRAKYLNQTLEVRDFKNLNIRQIQELETKKLKSNISFFGTISERKDVLKQVLNIIPLSQFVYLLNEDEELFKDAVLSAVAINNYGTLKESNPIIELLINEKNIETIRKRVSELLLENITEVRNYNFKPGEFSLEFRTQNSSLFPNLEEYPEELRQKMLEAKITIEDIIAHKELLSKVNLVPYLDTSKYEVREYIDVLKEHFGLIVTSFPELFKRMDELLSDYSIRAAIRDNLQSGLPFADNDPEQICKLFIEAFLSKYLGNNIYTYAKSNNPDIYEDTRYPEWLKNTGYYISKVVQVSDYYTSPIDFITKETIIEDSDYKILFDTFGYDNIKRVERKNYLFTPRTVRELAGLIARDKIEPATSYEDFQYKLLLLIYKTQGSTRKELLESVRNLKEVEFTNTQEFLLPEDAPQELKDIFYSEYFNIREVLGHDEWLPFMENINLSLTGSVIGVGAVQDPSIYPINTNFIEIYLRQNSSKDLLTFINKYRAYITDRITLKIRIDDLSKEALEKEFTEAIVTEIKRNNNVKIDPNSPSEFKQEHPELFISEDAPELLREFFYNRYLTLDSVREHPEWIPYLANVSPYLIKNLPTQIGAINSSFGMPQMVQQIYVDDFYVRDYGLQAYLEFMSQYALVCGRVSDGVIDFKDDSKESIEQQIEKIIYNNIIKNNLGYNEDLPEHFKEKYPDIFLSPDAPESLRIAYYSRQLKFEEIRRNPEYIKYLKDINLQCAFRDSFYLFLDDLYGSNEKTIPLVLENITKDQFLELISIYGEYLAGCNVPPDFFKANSFEELKSKIEDRIIEMVKNPSGNYGFKVKYQEDAPDFLKKALPEYFLDPEAPQDLKYHYYQITEKYQLTFDIIAQHKEWLPFLKGKDLLPSFKKLTNYNSKNNHIEMLELFGQDTAIRLATNRTETVSKMISANKVGLMHEWWLKTGKKFIPDYTVMQLFPIEEADKFLEHGKEWSSLMRNKRFSTTREGKEAMIKLAYSFGVFDGDQQGSKKLDTLLNDIPRKLSKPDMLILLNAESAIRDNYNQVKPGLEEYQLIRETLASEGFQVTSDYIFNEIYRQNEDETYTLIINTQEYPKSCELLRTFMEKNNLSTVISAAKAHTLFGAFNLTYDKDFRDFLLKNLEEFITNPDYVKYISAIQKQFTLIKITNSNRVLTPELAISFVQENKFENVEIGNEELSKVSSVAGYTQKDFETLQRIYNVGKTRVTSSIPRIEGQLGEYSYEILRLTDPLAVAIGTLTDCCQELGNAAEVCMEHSMVDKHGRVFVIKDQEGNIVAQSWVWRNKDVLCFDNIEIPDKAFTRAERSEKSKSRKEFTEEVYQVYKQAAQELIELDEKVYRELLENGLITQEQYEGLRLGKVTVGLGYNDIAEALSRNAPLDEEVVSRPLEFTPPVELTRDLYTSDSSTQRILEKRVDRKEYNGDTPTVHYDDLQIYDKTNINTSILITLNRLEATTGRSEWQMNTSVENTKTSKGIMQDLCYNYGTNLDNTKIIVTPNFAIIFEDTETEIRIVDAFTSSLIPKPKTILQMKVAILQLLKNDKKLNISSLSGIEQELINSIIELPESKLEEERGVSHGI